MRKRLLWLLPGLIVLAADRVVKLLCDGVTAPLIPGVLGLKSVHNTGMALGLAAGSASIVLIVSAALVIGCVAALRRVRLSGLAPLALSMMAGGAIGNAVDRVIYGYVIDMLELQFMNFYIFNVADVGVVVGAALCGVSLLFRPQDWSKK